jgi:hypothetical protein
MLMERFGSLEGFDWRPFIEAQSCSDNRYFLCWRRSHVSAKPCAAANPAGWHACRFGQAWGCQVGETQHAHAKLFGPESRVTGVRRHE